MRNSELSAYKQKTHDYHRHYGEQWVALVSLLVVVASPFVIIFLFLKQVGLLQ